MYRPFVTHFGHLGGFQSPSSKQSCCGPLCTCGVVTGSEIVAWQEGILSSLSYLSKGWLSSHCWACSNSGLPLPHCWEVLVLVSPPSEKHTVWIVLGHHADHQESRVHLAVTTLAWKSLARPSVASSLRTRASQSYTLRHFPVATSKTTSQSELNVSDTLCPRNICDNLTFHI